MIRLHKKAFTLIELLVVIAIIALLLAIILPSLHKTKDQAKFIVCKTGLHQYGLSGELYLTDFDNRFPDPYNWLHNYNQMTTTLACAWHDIRNDYDVDPEKAGWMWPYIDGKEVHVCPKLDELAKTYGQEHRGHDSAIPMDPQYTYCMNGYFGKKDPTLGLGPYSVVANKLQVKGPATCFFFCEENTWLLNGMSVWSLNNNHLIGRVEPYNPGDISGAFGSFHKISIQGIAAQVYGSVEEEDIGVSNAVFLDGHLEVVHPKDTFRLGWPK